MNNYNLIFKKYIDRHNVFLCVYTLCNIVDNFLFYICIYIYMAILYILNLKCKNILSVKSLYDVSDINFIFCYSSDVNLLSTHYKNCNCLCILPVNSFVKIDVFDCDIFIFIDKIFNYCFIHSFRHNFLWSCIHGFLHCIGYSHCTFENEFEMKNIERNIISFFDI